MPPRNAPSTNVADLRPGEDFTAAVFVRTSGRISIWCSDGVATPEQWERLYRNLQAAVDRLHQMQAEQR